MAAFRIHRHRPALGHPARRVWLGATVVVLIGAQLTGLLAFLFQG